MKITTSNKLLLLMGIVFPILSFSQNTCADALAIAAGTHVVNAIDGTQVPQPVCASNGAIQNANPRGKWYKYVPSQNYNLTVTTNIAANTPRIDTRFHVYTGSCSNLVCHDGDDDSGSNLSSIKTFAVAAGTTYYIAFDNRWSSNGFTFQLIENTFVSTPQNPINFTTQNISTLTGNHKICVVDMNGDYLDDIVTVSSTSIQIHYQQPTGGFTVTSIPTTAAQFMPTWSMAVGDYDKNGFNDLVYGGGNGVTIMKANSTGTGFTQISGPQYVFSQRSNFVDINNDGHLDIFVCHDVQPNVYYLNDGNGNLSFFQGGIGDHPQGGNYGSLWVDYDNDGDQDLFLAKCRGGSSTAKFNELHRNNGDGTFTNVSQQANLYDPLQTWSSAWNDYDNDGFMDVVVGASSSADGSHKLMKNNGDGTFSNITAGSGWDTNTTLNIEHVTYDFDNDGNADVFGGSGKIMFGNGDFTFFPVTYGISNGAIGDLNNDGFLDIQVNNTIHYNTGNNNNWIKINLQGIQSNRNGIGARIELYGSWGKQIRDIRSGEGFRHMSTLNAHFGIGTATSISQAVIIWPSGTIDVITNPSINQSLTVIEGSSPLYTVNQTLSPFILFPNPSSNIINLSNSENLEIKSIQIITADGKIIKNITLTNSAFSVADLANGWYSLIIETSNGKQFFESFIKN